MEIRFCNQGRRHSWSCTESSDAKAYEPAQILQLDAARSHYQTVRMCSKSGTAYFRSATAEVRGACLDLT